MDNSSYGKYDCVVSGLFETGFFNKLINITASLDNIQKGIEKTISINVIEFWLNIFWNTEINLF